MPVLWAAAVVCVFRQKRVNNMDETIKAQLAGIGKNSEKSGPSLRFFGRRGILIPMQCCAIGTKCRKCFVEDVGRMPPA